MWHIYYHCGGKQPPPGQPGSYQLLDQQSIPGLCQSLPSPGPHATRNHFPNLAPNLYWISNTIPYLQIFSYRIKVGTLSEKGASILKCTMEGYLCYVAHILSLWGETTPAWTTWVISTVGSTVNSRPMSEPTLPWTACNP